MEWRPASSPSLTPLPHNDSQPPAELVGKGRAGQIRDVADHPGHAHAGIRRTPQCHSSGRPAMPGRAGNDSRAIAFRRRPSAAGHECSRSHDGVDLVREQHAHSSACIPPSEPPATAASRSMPRTSRNARSVRTMSATVITGKSEPYGRPLAGSIDDGPVVPGSHRAGSSRRRRTVGVERLARADHAVPPAEPLAGARRPGPRPRTRPGCSPRGVARRPAASASPLSACRPGDVVTRRRKDAVGLVRDPTGCSSRPQSRWTGPADRGTAFRHC